MAAEEEVRQIAENLGEIVTGERLVPAAIDSAEIVARNIRKRLQGSTFEGIADSIKIFADKKGALVGSTNPFARMREFGKRVKAGTRKAKRGRKGRGRTTYLRVPTRFAHRLSAQARDDLLFQDILSFIPKHRGRPGGGGILAVVQKIGPRRKITPIFVLTPEVTIPPTPTFGPALNEEGEKIGFRYRKAVVKAVST